MIKGKKIDVSISNELLEIREKRWHKKLPIQFKNFVRENNGLIPEKRIILPDGSGIERFLCIHPLLSDSEEGYNDIDVILTKYDEFMVFSEDTVGYDLIPFAKLDRDKLLCLCYTDIDPCVVIWSYEGSNEFQPNYLVIYGSFAEFINHICK